MTAQRVAMSETADTDWATWDALLCVSGVFMGFFYPHVASMKARKCVLLLACPACVMYLLVRHCIAAVVPH